MTNTRVRRGVGWLAMGAAIAAVATIHAVLGATLLAVFALSAGEGGVRL